MGRRKKVVEFPTPVLEALTTNMTAEHLLKNALIEGYLAFKLTNSERTAGLIGNIEGQVYKLTIEKL